MFSLSISNFKCWKQLNLEFPCNKVTLIKGESGSGKTNVTQAIIWCLYGTIRHVAPNINAKLETKVKITLPHRQNIVTVERRRNPGGLYITINDQTYDDKVAQSIINELFGMPDIWFSSCHIAQKERNKFFSLSNSEKMQLLNTMGFHEEDPSTFIEKIDNYITTLDIAYKTNLTQFNAKLEDYKLKYSNVDFSKNLTIEQIRDFDAKIVNLRSNKQKGLDLRTQRDIKLGILDSLQKQLSGIIIPSPAIPPSELFLFNQSNNNSIDINIKEANIWLTQLIRKNDLLNQIPILPSIKSDISYTDNDYRKALTQELDHENNLQLAKKIGVSYLKSAIDDGIDKYVQLLAAQEQLKFVQQKENLVLDLNKLTKNLIDLNKEVYIPEIIPQIIEAPDYTQYQNNHSTDKLNDLLTEKGKLYEHIIYMEKGKDVLSCPHCHAFVRYQNNNIVSADSEPFNPEEISKTRLHFQNIERDICRINQEIKSKNLSEIQARQKYEMLLNNEQTRIKGLEETVNRANLEKQRIEISKQSLESQISTIKDKMSILEEELNKYPPLPSSLSKTPLSIQQINQANNVMNSLRSICIVELPKVSSKEIQKFFDCIQLSKQQEEIKNRYHNYINELPEIIRNVDTNTISIYLNKLRNFSDIQRRAFETIDRLSLHKGQIMKQIGEVVVPEVPNIELVDMEIKELELQREMGVYVNYAAGLNHVLTKEREEIIKLNGKLSKTMVLRQYAVNTQCGVLQEIVDNINNSIDEICLSLFDKSVDVKMELFKTIKSTKTVKPMVNFVIKYQGCNYENVSEISGGEGDRISIALTLALKKISPCPFMILDESLQSIGSILKEKVIDSIKDNIRGAVLLIMHDGVEGIFDSVVDIDQYENCRF